MVPGGTMSPKPLLTAFMTLSGWSPNTGIPTMGTPWNAACSAHAWDHDHVRLPTTAGRCRVCGRSPRGEREACRSGDEQPAAAHQEKEATRTLPAGTLVMMTDRQLSLA